MPRIAVIVPTFKAFDYSRRTLLSLFKYSPDTTAIVVDDASPDWNDTWHKDCGGTVLVHRFKTNGGLTRSWNQGLRMARGLDVEYIVCGNNDILFTCGWWRGMAALLNAGFGLVGPLSNAPGITARGLQDITAYVSNYNLTDNAVYNNNLAQLLWKTYADRVVPSPVNGFFLMAKKETWFENMADVTNVFNPVNTHTSKGKKNPTPLMTCNEDEFQRRLTRRKIKSGIAMGSFIFHYRSVSRGQKRYGKGLVMTMKDPEKPV